jgi:hypothetical protein
MALAKNGTRIIIVDDARYRWTIDANDEPGLGIVVALADRPAQRSVTWVDHGNIVTPKVVRHCIEWALVSGWIPSQRGPDVEFRIRGDLTNRPILLER